MIIDNQGDARVYKVYTLFYLVPAVILFVYAFLDFPQIEYIWLLISILCFAMVAWYNLQKPHYIHFEEDPKVFILRYYFAGLIKLRNSEIIIKREELYGYDIVSSFFGKRKALIIKIQKGTQVSRYKPIYISALSPKDTSNLKAILDQQIENNWE